MFCEVLRRIKTHQNLPKTPIGLKFLDNDRFLHTDWVEVFGQRQVVYKQIGLKLFWTLGFIQTDWFEVLLTLTGFFQTDWFEGFYIITGLLQTDWFEGFLLLLTGFFKQVILSF